MVTINGRIYIQFIHTIWTYVSFVVTGILILTLTSAHVDINILAAFGFFFGAIGYFGYFGIPKSQMVVYKLYKQFPEYFYKAYESKDVVDDYTFIRVVGDARVVDVLWGFIKFNKLKTKYKREMYDFDTLMKEFQTEILPLVTEHPELIIFRTI